jgi:hypothetical protein
MPITNTYGNNALNTMFSAPRFIALFTGDPTASGLFTQEFVGGGYVRKATGFTTSSTKSVAISNTAGSIWWTDLPNLPIRFIGVCTALSGGDIVAYKATGSDIYVAAGTRFVLDNGAVAFTISDV